MVFNNLNMHRPAAGEPDAADAGRGPHRSSTSSATPCTACSPTVTYPRFSGTDVPAGLRRVPEPGQRDVDPVAGGPGQLRPARRHRRAAARRTVAGDRRGRSCGAKASAPPSTWPRPCWTRPGTGWPPDTVVDRRRRVRGAGAGRGRRRASTWSRRATGARYFQHIFAGGYSAGYYSYIWSEVLDADTVEWFKENGGLSRDNGDFFRAGCCPRRAVDPLDAFRAFRGRDADIGPLLRRRGLAEAGGIEAILRIPARPEPSDQRRRRSAASGTAPGRGAIRRIAMSQPGERQHQVQVVGGGAVADQPVGLAVAAPRAAVHHLPALPGLLHQTRPAPSARGSRWPGRPAARRRAATTGTTGSGCGSARRCSPGPASSSGRTRSRCSPRAVSAPVRRPRCWSRGRSGHERLDGQDLHGDVLAVGSR